MPLAANLAELFSLEGRIALVTGAASGLGQAIAVGLAQAGAQVVLADINLEGAQRVAERLAQAGLEAQAIWVDVTDRASVESVVESITTEGQIEILVNSAGINVWGPAAQLAADTWQRILAVNLTGTFYCCQAIGRHMLARGRGNIINLGSIAGLAGFPGVLAYAVSKAGVMQLTRTLAVEWAPVVRVNALALSTFETPLVKRNRELRPEAYEELLKRIPLGRVGQPEEIVGSVLYLASEASSMVTGHVLAVDGGFLAQ